jgi:hypothetical protein
MNKSLAPTFLALLIGGATAHADVTIQDKTTVNVAIIKAHVTSTKSITDDKQRSESSFTCEGFMSMLCGKNETLDIIRLDESLTLRGDAKKKTYTEVPFPTPEQRKAMEEHMQAEMEKLKSCPSPVANDSPKVDTSKCEMSAPTTSVQNPSDTATFAGFSAHHKIMTMTQSCTNKETGDSCDMAYTFDLWLADNDIPDLATRQTFDQNYMHKLGIDTASGMGVPAQLNQFLGPYKDAMKQMASQAGSLKGYPLKTTFRFAFGGPHCASAKSSATGGTGGGSSGGSSGGLLGDAGGAAAGAAASSTTGAASSAASDSIGHAAGGSVGGYIAGSAAGAFANKMIGGLFSKKSASPPAATNGSNASAAPPADTAASNGLITVAEISSETTAITAGAIQAEQFEMPATWKKVIPQERAEKEPTCPKAGG